jgi:hypothetical protein
MERNRNGRPNNRKVGWLPEIDRLLHVGMKHGPKGIREVKKRLKQLAPGLTPGEIWKRMRHLRENSSDGHRDPRQWPPEIIQLLKDGYQYGGSRKKEALKILREQYPGVPSYVISRLARQQGWSQKPRTWNMRRPWTPYEEELLRRLAGYDSLQQIARNLRRTTAAVQFRLKAQGLSGKVKDGISLQAFKKMFHVGDRKAYGWIAEGALRVRDPRISARSLIRFCSKHKESLAAAAVANVEVETRSAAMGYSWDRVATLLGVLPDRVQHLVASQELKVVDTLISDKAFEQFCRSCGMDRGPKLNLSLMKAPILEWLVKEYSMAIPDAASQPVSPFVKQALVARVCGKCKREIRGNTYFAHIRKCRSDVVAGPRGAQEVLNLRQGQRTRRPSHATLQTRDRVSGV